MRYAVHKCGVFLTGSNIIDLLKVASVFDNNPHNWVFSK